jgi:cytochrome c peroxidase
VDRFKAGDREALSRRAQNGLELFEGRASCIVCHFGPDFSNAQFQNIGIGWNAQAQRFDDPGRAAVTGRIGDTGAFRTPTLRDVSKHPPYMHDGSLPTLEAVVEHYNGGGVPNPWLDGLITPLALTRDEVGDLVAFLESLEGEGYQDVSPKLFPQ